MRKVRELIASLVLVVGACFSTPALAAIPVVHHAVADTSAGTLTLNGENFGISQGRVWLGKTLLSIRSWGDKQIIATLPPGAAAGSHLATVQTGRSLIAFFVVDLAGVGGTGSIVGVVSACNTPVIRTLVYIPGRSFVVFTGATGAFRIDNVPPGTYNVLIETPGQPPVTRENVSVAVGEATDLDTITVIDLTNNAQHCGACGNSCGGGPNVTASCFNSACLPPTCSLGWANCNGSLADGCEVHIQTNTQNCGACGVTCAIGSTCVAGLCMGPTPPLASCTTDAQCMQNQFCDIFQGRCQFDLINAMPCNRDAQCQSGNCQAGMCMGTPTPQPGQCTTDSQCSPLQHCGPMGTCQADFPNGAPCTSIFQCLSGSCSGGPNGVCQPANCPAGFVFCPSLAGCIQQGGAPCPP